MLNFMIPFTLLTLFVPFKTKIGNIQLRPFDACVAILLIYMLLNIKALRRSRFTMGFAMLLPFYLVHVLSAFSYEFSNGIRELLQVSLLLSFAFTVSAYLEHADYEKMGQYLLIGLFGVMLFNVGWHIEHGFWTGWKRLLDPKAAFNFLPMLLAVLIAFSNPGKRSIYWYLWAFVGLIILFSGERKALLIYGILSVSLLSKGRILAALPVAAIGLFGLVLFSSVVDNQYVARQIRTILEPSSNELSLTAIASGEMPVSLSNAQRKFALRQATELWESSPIVGVGTNAYVEIIRSRFAFLPDYMLAGVHGEFLRTLVENGTIGFVFYVLVLYVAIYRLFRVLKYLEHWRFISTAQKRILPVIFLVPPFFYVGFEASGSRVLVTGIMISLVPEILFWGFCRREAISDRRQNAEATDVTQSPRSHGVARTELV